MLVMTKKEHRGKLTARTPALLRSRVRAWLGEVSEDHPFRNRKLGLEDFIAVVMLDFMERPAVERSAVLRDRIPQLERMYEEEPTEASSLPQEAGAELAPATPPGPVQAPAYATKAQPSRRRGKRA